MCFAEVTILASVKKKRCKRLFSLSDLKSICLHAQNVTNKPLIIPFHIMLSNFQISVWTAAIPTSYSCINFR